MHSERLLRHYPELHDLPRDTQIRLIDQAKNDTFGPTRKLHNWRLNLVTLAVIAAISLFIVLGLGPALGWSERFVAGVMMVVVLPVFIYVQHRRYIAQLRPALARQLARQRDQG